MVNPKSNARKWQRLLALLATATFLAACAQTPPSGATQPGSLSSADLRWLKHYGFSAFAAPNPASGLS